MDLVALQKGLDTAAFAILLLTMLLYWSSAAFARLPQLTALATAGMAIANVVLAGLLGARWLESGHFPISNLYESLVFLAWGLTAVHLLAERWSRSRLVGVATAPLSLGVVAFAALYLPSNMQSAEPLVPALQSNWLMMHVSIMMLAYATLMVGSLLAMAFLVVTRGQPIRLHGSSIGIGSERRPPAAPEAAPAPQQGQGGEASDWATGAGTAAEATVLTAQAPPTTGDHEGTLSPQRLTLADTLDNVSYRTIGLGFPLLTVGIIAGAVWANEAWGSYWSWDPKETWALITWLVFAAYLHARITRGWQGRKPALLATAGFVMVWICYLGVNLMGIGLHSYGWFLQ